MFILKLYIIYIYKYHYISNIFKIYNRHGFRSGPEISLSGSAGSVSGSAGSVSGSVKALDDADLDPCISVFRSES